MAKRAASTVYPLPLQHNNLARGRNRLSRQDALVYNVAADRVCQKETATQMSCRSWQPGCCLWSSSPGTGPIRGAESQWRRLFHTIIHNCTQVREYTYYTRRSARSTCAYKVVNTSAGWAFEVFCFTFSFIYSARLVVGCHKNDNLRHGYRQTTSYRNLSSKR